MKNLRLIMATTFILASSAKANLAETFYVRADAGIYENINQKIDSLKVKSKIAHSLDLGFGYNVTDNTRAELVFSHLINPIMNTPEIEDEKIRAVTNDRKVRGKIDALMLKGYYDATSFEAIKFYVGAGFGIARVSEKVTGNNKEIIKGHYGSAFDIVADKKVNEKLRAKNNFAYTLACGVGLNLSENVRADIQYNWSDYGHAKSSSGIKIKRRGHAIKIGFRFNINAF